MSSLDPKERSSDENSSGAEVKPKNNKCLIITIVTVVVVCVAGLAIGLGVGLTRNKPDKLPAAKTYKSIAFITPMESELNGVLDALAPKGETEVKKNIIGQVVMHSFEYQGIKIVAALCGIGKVNSAYSTSVVLQEHKPDAIINVGVAGGFSEDQKIMDFVFSTNFVYTDVDCHGENSALGQISGEPKYFPAEEDLLNLVKTNQDEFIKKLDLTKYPDYKRDKVNFFYGTIGSADQFIWNPTQVSHITTNFPEVICVEMEGASIAHVAHKFKTPILTVRSLSDIAVSDHDNSEDYQNSFVDASNIAGEMALLLLRKIAERNNS